MSFKEALSTKNKVLAVDLDDVISISRPVYLDRYNRLFGTTFTPEDMQYRSMYKCGWGSKELAAEKHAIIFGAVDELHKIEPLEGAKEGLLRLKELGWKLVIVTARKEHSMKLTKEWLDKHYAGLFDGVQASGWGINSANLPSVSKPATIRAIGASLLIEDCIETALECAESRPPIPVLLFGNYHWNRYAMDHSPEGEKRDEEKLARGDMWKADDPGQALPECVRRVKDWKEVVTFFESGGERVS